MLRLSDMYTVKEKSYKLELEATMLNINGTHNQNLKEACRTLKEYAIYTDKIRKYTEKMSLEDAVELAICECIEEGILKEFLEKHRAEAKAMSIFEYDQEKHLRMEREEAWEEGRREGEENTKRIFKLSLMGKTSKEDRRGLWNPRGESKADFRVSQKVKAKIPNLYWRIRRRFDRMDTG